MNVYDKYKRRVAASRSLLCVGLDCALDRIPARFLSHSAPQFEFNRYIIEQTHSYVSAYKPNMAFYEAQGAPGLQALQLTMDYLRSEHPDIVTICDAKRGDNRTSNQQYAIAVFDQLGFDAVTLQPYMGSAVLEPFLERADKANIILCRTSNPGDAELQELPVQDPRGGATKPLWRVVAEKVRDEWNTRGNCMLVVGATVPDILRQVRALAPELPILAPGVGAQGADLLSATRAGVAADGCGLFLSASRSVIYHEQPAEEARRTRDVIANAALVSARA